MHDSTTHYRYLLHLAWGVLSTCQCQRGCVKYRQRTLPDRTAYHVFFKIGIRCPSFRLCIHKRKPHCYSHMLTKYLTNTIYITEQAIQTTRYAIFLPHPIPALVPPQKISHQPAEQQTRKVCLHILRSVMLLCT